jgi:hypothetical protein
MNSIEPFFWLSVAAVVYSIVGYPLVLLMIASLRQRAVRSLRRCPTAACPAWRYSSQLTTKGSHR